MRARALSTIARLLFFLVIAGALVALVTRVDQYPAASGPVQPVGEGGRNQIIVSSGPGGALVYSVKPGPATSDGAQVAAYLSNSARAWIMSGIEDAIAADLPEAVVWRFSTAQEDGNPVQTTLLRISRDGRQEQIAQSNGELRAWYANSSTTVYTVTVYDGAGVGRSRIITQEGTRQLETVLPGGGLIEHLSVSADGCRLAAISAADQGHKISWLERSPGQAWRLMADMPTSACYVTLSPDGRQAVLGPQSPLLAGFGEVTGRPLPTQYVSEARFGISSLLLVFFRIEAGRPLTTASVVDIASGDVLWKRDFGDDLGIATCRDRLAYVQPGGRKVVVVDLEQGGEQHLRVQTADDVGFRDTDSLFVVHRDGTVQILSIGD